MGKQYVVSPYAFVRKASGKVLIYHSLLLFKMIGDERLSELLELFREGREGRIVVSREDVSTLKMLKKKRFIIPEDDVGTELDRFREAFVPKVPDINLMYLFPTNDCNLNCKYCAIEGGRSDEFRKAYMTKQTAKKAIDIFLRIVDRNKKESRVILYGGEPLLNWKTTRFIIDYLREKEKSFGRKFAIIMVTNGTLMDEEKARFLIRSKVMLAFSMDGRKEYHDQMRVYRGSGKGTFDDVLKGFRLYDALGGNPSISCVISRHNHERMKDVVKYFKRLGIGSCGLNMIVGADPGSKVYVEPEKVGETIFNAAREFFRNEIYEEKAMRKIRPFVIGKPYIYECGGYGNQIAVSASGDVGICHVFLSEGKYVLGKVSDGDIVKKIRESSDLVKWSRRTPFNMPQCMDCIGLGICGGGCAYEAFKRKGDIFELDERFCKYCIHVVEYMISRLIDNSLPAIGAR